MNANGIAELVKEENITIKPRVEIIIPVNENNLGFKWLKL